VSAVKKARGGPDREKRMSLGAHLIELRRRLFRSALAVVLGSVAGWFLTDLCVWNAIQEPVTQVARAKGTAAIVFPTISSAFDLRLQIAVTVGLVLSSPVWLFQIFAFLVPGLKKRERRYTLGFFLTAIPLFFVGCAAGWYVLPHIVTVLTSFVPQGAESLLTAKEYVDFVLKLILVIGVAFVLPVFIVLLNFVGVMSADAIIKGWRVAILLIVLFTAFATPSADVVSMFLLAIPLIFLYFAAWFIGFLHDRRAAKQLALLIGHDLQASA